MLYAQGLALERNVPLKVCFNMVPKFSQATLRQYSFMMEGLQQVESSLREKNIPFTLLFGDPTSTVPAFAQEQKALAVVCDFSPLKVREYVICMNRGTRVMLKMVHIWST